MKAEKKISRLCCFFGWQYLCTFIGFKKTGRRQPIVKICKHNIKRDEERQRKVRKRKNFGKYVKHICLPRQMICKNTIYFRRLLWLWHMSFTCQKYLLFPFSGWWLIWGWIMNLNFYQIILYVRVCVRYAKKVIGKFLFWFLLKKDND